jgi:hypothetical protein
MAIEKAPDRARREGYAVPPQQQISQLNQRDVDLSVDRRQDHLPVGLDATRAALKAAEESERQLIAGLVGMMKGRQP